MEIFTVHFSGRCEKEAYGDNSLERDEPARFSRYLFRISFEFSRKRLFILEVNGRVLGDTLTCICCGYLERPQILCLLSAIAVCDPVRFLRPSMRLGSVKKVVSRLRDKEII